VRQAGCFCFAFAIASAIATVLILAFRMAIVWWFFKTEYRLKN
jgi:hypothetical protein